MFIQYEVREDKIIMTRDVFEKLKRHVYNIEKENEELKEHIDVIEEEVSILNSNLS